MLVATVPIEPGAEIYVSYGRDNWRDRLHFLSKELRERIQGKIKGNTVDFLEEVTVAEF